MHEVGVINAILKNVEKVMEDEDMSSCDVVALEIGELSGVVPHFMEECWPAVTINTRFEHTKLVMNVIKGQLKCDKCGEDFYAYDHDLICPKCGEDRKYTPIAGRELIIKEIRGN